MTPPTPDWEGVPPPRTPTAASASNWSEGVPPPDPQQQVLPAIAGGGYPPYTPSDPQQQLLIFIDFQWFSLILIDTMTPATPVCSSISFFQVFAFFIPDVNKISSSFSCRFFLS